MKLPHPTSADRLLSLDVLRGVAVMGILLMNIIDFSMPVSAYLNPRAYGGLTSADLAGWVTMFVVADNKMRGLFSLLFGASMLLVIERAEAKEEDGAEVHLRRMGWLFLFGYAHLLLLWNGDILALYALCGAIAYLLRSHRPPRLLWIAFGLFAANALLWAAFFWNVYALQASAALPGADPARIKELADALAGIGAPASAQSAEELQTYVGSYAAILRFRWETEGTTPWLLLTLYGAETVGLMAMGMAFYKNGFLTGNWPRAAYARLATWAYLFGLAGTIPLAIAIFASGFDVLFTATAEILFTIPFRISLMLGHAALILWLLQGAQGKAWVDRVAATGRMAFSNYLGTSLVMTTFFYGYGLGYYGSMSRWQVYLLVPCMWGLMLLWSKPWLHHFHYGPLEWVWRSLARWERQPFRRRG